MRKGKHFLNTGLNQHVSQDFDRNQSKINIKKCQINILAIYFNANIKKMGFFRQIHK